MSSDSDVRPDQQRLWGEETARSYDTPGQGMFSPEVLGPTTDLLADLAAGGIAVELAIGTGRVAIPLHEAGVAVTGIELSDAMIARLREKASAHEIPVVRGDMTTADAGAGHTVVYLVFNTIGPSEMDLLAQLAGLRLESRWADWDRSTFTAKSRSHVSV